MKNTFVYLYHSIYGKGYWFDGMNYPYGEHIVYTDGMPFLTVTLAHIPGITVPVAMTILWWLLALSYLLAVAYVYKILVHYRVRIPIAILFAALIVFFSPQLFRLRSHYGLAFACVIPMLFYWTTQYLESGRIKYCIYIFALGVIMTFMHPYHAGLFLIWAGCYSLGVLFFQRCTLKEKLRHVVPIITSAMAILLSVALIMKVTDPLKDRPTGPYNSPDYFTHLKQLLISAHSPFWQFVQEHGLIRSANTDGEGYAYAGVVCLIVVGISLLLVIIRKIKFNKYDNNISIANYPLVWLFMAVSVLLLSMGGPMLISPKAINYLSFFKQFRSLGRFSWVYYYIITIYAVVIINYGYSALQQRGKKMLAYVLLIATFGLWAFEASGYIWDTRSFGDAGRYNYDMIFSTNEKDWPTFLKEHNLKRDDFQGAMILPYFHLGTDKLWVCDPGWEMTLCAKACLQLRLPMTDVLMSRSSWSIAEKQVRIAGGPFADKGMLRDLHSDKPFLVLYFDEVPISPDEKDLFRTFDSLGQFSQCKVYTAYPQRILAYERKVNDSISAIAATLPTGDTCLACNGSYYIEHFDKYRDKPFFGSGAMPYKEQPKSFASMPISVSADSQLYELSAWFLLSTKDFRSPDIVVKLLDSTEKVISTESVRTLQSVDNHGLWFRTSKYFKIPPTARRIYCMIEDNGEPSYLAIDELQLRPAGSTVISKQAGKVMVNNHLLVK